MPGLSWLCRQVATGLLVLATLPSAAYAGALTDDLGQQISFAVAPRRIVSLLPSLTETLCALGACSRLVGVDDYSNFPPETRALPQLGGGLNPRIEAVLRLTPDVVLIASSSPAIPRLRSLGVKVVALEPKSYADVRRTIFVLGNLLGEAPAQALWDGIERDLSQAAGGLSAQARQQRVYFEVNRAPYAASESSFIGETLKRLGVSNVVPAALGLFPKLNPEFVVRANPDVIMVGDSDPQAMESRPGWQRIRAVQGRRVCVFNQRESDILVRPGPRMAEGARLMAQCLNRFAP
jgi:iron complex transport system substrate-binding protein